MNFNNPSYPLTLLLSCTPLGWFGLHHFYLGRNYRGVLYLIFVWTTIPIFASYIDLILMVKRGQDSFVEKYYDSETKEDYYVKQLVNQNPTLIDPESDMSNIDSIEDVKHAMDKEKLNHIYSDKNDVDETEREDEKEDDLDDETEKRKIKDPDYSDYYGNW